MSIEKELKTYKKYFWIIDGEKFFLISLLNMTWIVFPFFSVQKNCLIGVLFFFIYGIGVPYIIFKYINSKVSEKNLNLIGKIVELEEQLAINEVYFKELYNEIDLILNNGKEVVLEELPAYKELLKVPVKLKNNELKTILKAEPELIRNQININDYLINDVSEYNEKLNKLTYVINVKNQELILNKGK